MTGVVAWFTGLPAAGKSTLARAVAAALRAHGRQPLVLDGDEVRDALGSHAYDDAARDRFYHQLAALAALAARQGLVVLVPATAHRRAWRDAARAAAPRFVEIFVDTPADQCRARDPKALYAAADAAATLPGVGVAFEPPAAAEIIVHPGDDAAVAIAARLLAVTAPG